MSDKPVPTNIRVRRQSRVLSLTYGDGTIRELPFELLRVYSPSAEVKGHGAGPGPLQTGKRDVELTAVQPVGNYAVQLSFSDGHDSGIYSWDYLWELASRQDAYWRSYLTRLEAEGGKRSERRE